MGPLPPTGPVGSVLRLFFERIANDPVEPNLTITDRLSLAAYGVDAEAEVIGGHTPGSLVVRTGGVAIVGDLVRAGFMGGRLNPRHPLRHYFADDSAKVRQALALVLDGGPDQLLVGHGGPLDTETVRRQFDRVAPDRGEAAAGGRVGCAP
jgi:glyoxylase-like metal-dependent hydrolase (beta-lactamase superfamily II)